MKTTRFLTAAAIVVAALAQFGCGKKDGDTFVGNWRKLNGRGSSEMTISRNGEGNNFYIASKVANLDAESKKDAMKTHRVSAFYADGKMVLMVGVPFALTIDESSGHLVTEGAEYQKAE
jgi:hypothetical protein